MGTIIVIILIVTVGVFMLTAFTGAPYVPSVRRELRTLFDELRPVSSRDTLVDIGSGDGVVLLEAASRGARVVGYEINPYLVWISRLRLRMYRQHAQVVMANFWHTPLPDHVTVVYTFGESRDIIKMYERVQAEATRLKRSIDFVSYGFEVPGKPLVRKHRAYFLYRITPLHEGEA